MNYLIENQNIAFICEGDEQMLWSKASVLSLWKLADCTIRIHGSFCFFSGFLQENSGFNNVKSFLIVNISLYLPNGVWLQKKNAVLSLPTKISAN